MIPVHFYYKRKSIQPRYSYTPSGDLDINQLLRHRPYWRQSIASTVEEKKILILTDWSAQNWSEEKLLLVKDHLVEMLDAGFSIYAWQSGQVEELNKEYITQFLQEPAFLERLTIATMPKDIEAAAISQLPNVAKDTILLLDDFQINGLIQPNVFNYPREIDVADLLKYRHDIDLLIPVLSKLTPQLTGFTDSDVSEESYALLEKLQERLPSIPVKTRFKKAKLSTEIINTLFSTGTVLIARRTLNKEQLLDLEEVVLDGLSIDALVQVLPYLTNVKKLTLSNFTSSDNLSNKITTALPNLEQIKLLYTKINSLDFVSLVKDSSQLRTIQIYAAHLQDNGPLFPISSRCLEAIKVNNGTISKRNYQDLLLHHKVKHLLFSGNHILSDTLTEIKDTADLSCITNLEISRAICDASYLNQMFALLPQLEHVCIRGGTIKRFTNTFSLKALKTLEMDVSRFNDLASAFDGLKIEKLILIDKYSTDVPQLQKLDLSNMRYFSISNSELNHSFLEDILQRATSLHYLELKGCTNLESFKSTPLWQNIHTLNLSTTDISTTSLEHILENAPRLKRLDLSGCSELVLTPRLRALMNRIQVYYPDHIKLERKKPNYNQFVLNTKSSLENSQLLLDQSDSESQEADIARDNDTEEGHSRGKQVGRNVEILSGDEQLGLQTKTSLENGQADAKAQETDTSKNTDATLQEDHTEGTLTDTSAERLTRDEFVDADTKIENKEYSLNVVFFPINSEVPLPAVSQYRNKIFNEIEISAEPCSLQHAFKIKKTGDLNLQACNAKQCTHDIFGEANPLEQSTDSISYYAKTSLQLNHTWQPLPSLSAQETLTHYHIEPTKEVELQYSLRDNQYYIRSKQEAQETISIDYIIRVPSPSKALPPHIQRLVDYFVGSKEEEGFAARPLTLSDKPTGEEYINAILEQKKGRCSHRSIAFVYRMKQLYPETLVRIMSNQCHAQVEVFIDGEWVSCDLGGYPAKLNLDTKNDPRKKEHSLGGELLKEDTQIAQYLQTWKKTKRPELSLESYCEQLTEPRQQKKYLIEMNNPGTQQALSLAIKSHCQQNNKPVFYISKPDNLTCSAPYITNVDGVGLINDGPGGPLYSFLTQTYNKGNPPILLINAEQFDTEDLVQHNSLFDHPPKVDGILLPEGAIVLLLINGNKPNLTLGEDLTSRMDVIEQCPLADKTLYLAYPPVIPKEAQAENSEYSLIDLFYSEQWESLLLGQWIIKGNDLYFEEGLLQEALKHHSRINLCNGLWDNTLFQNFWQEALHNGFIDYEGQRIPLPKEFDLVIQSGYDWKKLESAIEFKEGIDANAKCLNPNQLNLYFSHYEHMVETHGMRKVAGLIKKSAGQNVTINLTRELDEHEWARLLSECVSQAVHLTCHCVPGVVLPEVLAHKYRLKAESTPTTAYSQTRTAPCRIVKSSDRDTTLAQVTAILPDNVFIDASELEDCDILEQTHGEFLAPTRTFNFKRIERCLTEALNDNKHVILTGTLSNSLLDSLMPLLLSHNTDPKGKGTLTLIVDDSCEYKLPYVEQHEVSSEEKLEELKKKFSNSLITRLTQPQIEKDSLSQLGARLRYLKLHPEEKDSTKAWDGLYTLTSQINLPEFDLSHSEENAQTTIKKLINDIKSRLSDSPTLYLSGLTGVGKTTFIEKHLSKEPNITVYYGEEKLETWAKDHSEQLKIVFIDEANLSQRQWSEFEGLFQIPPSIIINGKHYKLDKNHAVVFAGNPLNYGNERQVASLFKRHGNARVFEPMTGEFIYEMILKPLFANTDQEAQSKVISQQVLGLYRYLVNLSTNEVLISARELQLIVLLTLACQHHHPEKDIQHIVDHYIHQIGSTMVPYEHQGDFDSLFKPTECLYPKQTTPVKLKSSNYLITPSRQEIYQLMVDLIQLRAFRQTPGMNTAQKFGGISSIVFEGNPGVGKSELVRAILKEYLFEEATLTTEPTSKQVFYQIPIGMRNDQKGILFRRGLAKGAASLLDEINSAPMMERWINDLLMNKDPVTKEYPEESGALLFGTQNPVTMAGRKKPSNAVKRRVINYTLMDYPPEEMIAILQNEGCSAEVAEQMVRVFVYLVNYAQKNYLSPMPTFRDLLRVARIASKFDKIESLNTFYASIDKPSLREALIKAEDRFNSATVLALANYLTPATIRLFDLHIRLFESLITKEFNEKKIQFVLNFLTILMPKPGEMSTEQVEYFNILCGEDIEKIPHFDKLNDLLAGKPLLIDAFFKQAKATNVSSAVAFLLYFKEVPALIELLVTQQKSELLDLLHKQYKESDDTSLELITTYNLTHMNVSGIVQTALIHLFYLLSADQSSSLLEEQNEVSWADALIKISPQSLLKFYEFISDNVEDIKKKVHSIFYKSLLSNLEDEEQIDYIQLMIEDEQARAYFQAYPHVFAKPKAYKLYAAKVKQHTELELITLLDEFKEYPTLQQFMTSSAGAFALCQANAAYCVNLIKDYAKKHPNSNSDIPLLKLAHLMRYYTPKGMLLWHRVFVNSNPEEIRKIYSALLKGVSEIVLKSLLREINRLIDNQQLAEQDKVSYLQFIMKLTVKDIDTFQKLTALLNQNTVSLSSLLERLKGVPFSELLPIIRAVSNTTLVHDVLFEVPPLANISSHILQQSEAYKEYIALKKNVIDKKEMTQFIELYHFLATNAAVDKALWRPILLDANPMQLDTLHGWMNRFKENKKPVFLNLIYTKAHQLDFAKIKLTEETLIADTERLLNSPMKLFELNASFHVDASRVRLLHHLERKTFVVPATTTIQGLWTGLKNCSLLKTIYEAYSQLMTQKIEKKAELLLIAKELTAIPDNDQVIFIKQDLKDHLNGVVSNYLHSFWIRAQRKNSARALLNSINQHEASYSRLLSAIEHARNEVFTNDTEKERGMHRFGSSRYYQTLNQLEELLVHHWIQDKKAISDFKRFLTHYKVTLDHSKQCFNNAIQHENGSNKKEYHEDTPVEKLPGYLKALKREIELRENAYAKYEQLLKKSTVEQPNCTAPYVR